MLETASLLSFFLAFALLHGAAPSRFPLKRSTPSGRVIELMKFVALAAIGLGVAVWSRTENTRAALLLAATALSLSGTLFVLLAAVFPRAAWSVALACLPLVVALLVAGSGHG